MVRHVQILSVMIYQHSMLEHIAVLSVGRRKRKKRKKEEKEKRITPKEVDENSQVPNARFQAAGAVGDAAIREWGMLTNENRKSLILSVGKTRLIEFATGTSSILFCKVRRTGPYWHTEIWLVRYGSVTIDFDYYRSVTVDFDRYRVCSFYRPVQGGPRTGKPSDWYIPPIPGGMENLAILEYEWCG
ncbi:hypothetical protein B296_00054435 [Ensete ventricosum]|uniref:Uncharacterized protein n=1 Tax=Ensete ventricosum TaxID=4639 RepID=A0A426XML5_ENSVE|nr:hypothetical protein B296_00054435 [Ensete ventricosum]